MQSDMENEKAVLMGNKESVIFIYMLNCVICVLFFITGILMWRAAKPTLEMTDYLDQQGSNDSIDQVPADLRKHTRVEAFLIQRSKFKYCMFVSLMNTLLIMLSTIMRILITFDTYQKEEKILMSYQTLQN